MMGLALVPAPPTPSEPFLAGVLDHIEAAAAALPSRPDAALRELWAARSLLLTRLRPVPQSLPAPAMTDLVRLTAREAQVLRLLAEGDRNKEIALRLRLRERTVKFHVANLLHKLGAQSRTEALRRAIELGLLQTGRAGDE